MPKPSIRFALRIASLCGIAFMSLSPAVAEDGGGLAASSSSRSFDGERHDRGERYHRRAFGEGGSFLRADRDRRIRYDGRHDDDRRYGDDHRREQYGSTLTTFDVGDWGGSFIYYGPPPAYGAKVSAGIADAGPKIIDIATERLDRRPIGPSGIDIVETGGAKIIRIAPGYRMSDAKRRSTPNPNAKASSAGMQPWSSGWLAYCTRTYRSFDADLGTYVAKDGRIRFCSAE